MNLFKEGDISLFNWSELHNKTVRVIVVEDSGMQSVGLYDTETKELFIISVKPVEGNK